jgi:hypothetical protein
MSRSRSQVERDGVPAPADALQQVEHDRAGQAERGQPGVESLEALDGPRQVEEASRGEVEGDGNRRQHEHGHEGAQATE